MPFDIEIDKLTNSIENALTEEVFPTEISRLSGKDSGQVKKTEGKKKQYKGVAGNLVAFKDFEYGKL